MSFTIRQIPKRENLTLPRFAVSATMRAGVSMEGALAIVPAAEVIASNKALSMALLVCGEWLSVKAAFPCWSGTMTAYEETDKKLGKSIEYADPNTGIRYVFPVPDQYVNEKNVVLVTECPNFIIEADGNTRIVRAKTVGMVSEFPVVSEAWYAGDPIYDLPSGNAIDRCNPGARYLWRSAKRVGLTTRDCGFSRIPGCDFRRDIILTELPSSAFGVISVLVDANAVGRDSLPILRRVE